MPDVHIDTQAYIDGSELLDELNDGIVEIVDSCLENSDAIPDTVCNLLDERDYVTHDTVNELVGEAIESEDMTVTVAVLADSLEDLMSRIETLRERDRVMKRTMVEMRRQMRHLRSCFQFFNNSFSDVPYDFWTSLENDDILDPSYNMEPDEKQHKAHALKAMGELGEAIVIERKNEDSQID